MCCNVTQRIAKSIARAVSKLDFDSTGIPALLTDLGRPRILRVRRGYDFRSLRAMEAVMRAGCCSRAFSLHGSRVLWCHCAILVSRSISAKSARQATEGGKKGVQIVVTPISYECLALHEPAGRV